MEAEMEYTEERKLLSEFVQHTLGNKMMEDNSRWNNFDFNGKTLGEIDQEFSHPPLTEQEKAAQLIGFMLTMRYQTFDHPVSIYKLQSSEDNVGKMVIEGSNLHDLLVKMPELKSAMVVSNNNFFGVKVLRVRMGV